MAHGRGVCWIATRAVRCKSSRTLGDTSQADSRIVPHFYLNNPFDIGICFRGPQGIPYFKKSFCNVTAQVKLAFDATAPAALLEDAANLICGSDAAELGTKEY